MGCCPPPLRDGVWVWLTGLMAYFTPEFPYLPSSCLDIISRSLCLSTMENSRLSSIGNNGVFIALFEFWHTVYYCVCLFFVYSANNPTDRPFPFHFHRCLLFYTILKNILMKFTICFCVIFSLMCDYVWWVMGLSSFMSTKLKATKNSKLRKIILACSFLQSITSLSYCHIYVQIQCAVYSVHSTLCTSIVDKRLFLCNCLLREVSGSIWAYLTWVPAFRLRPSMPVSKFDTGWGML